MSYENDIPQPTDLISNSQGQILGNFAAIDSGTTGTGIGFSRNHITMTDGVNGGLHYRVDYFAPQTSPVISGFTSSTYPKSVNSISELFYKNGTKDTQITSSSLAATSGEGFIPGGLQIRSGTGSTGAIAFTTAFATACLAVVATPLSAGNQINVTAKSTTGFTVVANPVGSVPFSWIAIGY